MPVNEVLEAEVLIARFTTIVNDAVHNGETVHSSFLKLIKKADAAKIMASHDQLVRLRRIVAKDANGLYLRQHHVVTQFIAKLDAQLDTTPTVLGSGVLTMGRDGIRTVDIIDPASLVRSTRRRR